jgi:hypothetical protein
LREAEGEWKEKGGVREREREVFRLGGELSTHRRPTSSSTSALARTALMSFICCSIFP